MTDVIIGTQSNLWDNNPYSNGSVFRFKEGDRQLNRVPLTYTKGPKDKTYTILQGDTLHAIAQNMYGSSKWYWVLQDVNNYVLSLDITIGDNIVIPDLDTLFSNQKQ